MSGNPTYQDLDFPTAKAVTDVEPSFRLGCTMVFSLAMMKSFSLAVFVLFSVSALVPRQPAQAANKCSLTYGELYSAVKEILFEVSDNHFRSGATLEIEPSWERPELQITIQFPDGGTPIVTSFNLAPGEKAISASVGSAIKAGTCDAASIAKQVKVVKKNVPVNESLKPLIDQLWHLDIVPQQLHSVHVDATTYILDVYGQDHIRVVTDDYDSPVVKWMEQIRTALNNE